MIICVVNWLKVARKLDWRVESKTWIFEKHIKVSRFYLLSFTCTEIFMAITCTCLIAYGHRVFIEFWEFMIYASLNYDLLLNFLLNCHACSCNDYTCFLRMHPSRICIVLHWNSVSWHGSWGCMSTVAYLPVEFTPGWDLSLECETWHDMMHEYGHPSPSRVYSW